MNFWFLTKTKQKPWDGFCLVEKYVFIFYKRFKRFYNVFYKHHFLSIFLSSYNCLKIFVIYWITSLSQQRIQGGDWGHWGHVPVCSPYPGQVKEKNVVDLQKKVQNLKNFRLRRLSAIFSPKFCNFNNQRFEKNYQFFRAVLRRAVLPMLPMEKQVLTPSSFISSPKIFLAILYNI